MAKSYYSLDEVLRVAQKHPFYNPDVQFPPHPEDIPQIIKSSDLPNGSNLCRYRIIKKKDIFDVIQRLATDDSPSNTFRYSSYTSVTGGGWSRGIPMLFLTDSAENKRQRETMGAIIKAVGIIEARDWVVNIHVSGYLYRSLDLLTDALEYAGGTVLCAGSDMSPQMVTDVIQQYRCNCLTGPVTELIKMTHHIASLPTDVREQVKINKIFYTSEPLSRSQHDFLTSTFGSSVAIYSGMGSAEAGLWAVANPQLTGEPETDAAEFIYDTRTMHVEILPLSNTKQDNAWIEPVPDEEMGIITLTSLQRLRNPLVRYDSGDIGSLHPLPLTAQAQIPADVVEHLKLLRVYGRDKRFSFSWNSNYFEYTTVHNLMQSEGYGILQWQIVMGQDQEAGTEYLEIRLLRDRQQAWLISDEELVGKIKWAFLVITNPGFRVKFVNDVAGFERSSTGRKVIRFVDYR
ncbi:hypothetical protein BDV26DRAFT_279488 [Aspergillus bertholletiae]|uniref:AMP-dependent synthetase/ligase domain-containing protein n=1 Tax=Aspergillus bertholletiae TaxID=1226010 RepID=A0A5N7BF81_9EURO|nr:hypothetical protein BDV26DRAFT_279488 [Aspergillus bertholletiae]